MERTGGQSPLILPLMYPFFFLLIHCLAPHVCWISLCALAFELLSKGRSEWHTGREIGKGRKRDLSLEAIIRPVDLIAHEIDVLGFSPPLELDNAYAQ